GYAHATGPEPIRPRHRPTLEPQHVRAPAAPVTALVPRCRRAAGRLTDPLLHDRAISDAIAAATARSASPLPRETARCRRALPRRPSPARRQLRPTCQSMPVESPTRPILVRPYPRRRTTRRLPAACPRRSVHRLPYGETPHHAEGR